LHFNGAHTNGIKTNGVKVNGVKTNGFNGNGTSHGTRDIHAENLRPPSFIPENFLLPSKMVEALSVHMMGVFNSHERSLVSTGSPPNQFCIDSDSPQTQLEKIINRAGLRIVAVHSTRGMTSAIECALSSSDVFACVRQLP
jgi:hypothetical protein